MAEAVRGPSHRLAIGQGGRSRADRLDQPVADTHVRLAVDHVVALKRADRESSPRAGASPLR
jgi:hypothetical protein